MKNVVYNVLLGFLHIWPEAWPGLSSVHLSHLITHLFDFSSIVLNGYHSNSFLDFLIWLMKTNCSTEPIPHNQISSYNCNIHNINVTKTQEC